ncbi:NERD domain-containing protein [Vibrio sp. SCSIO 43140]|uniref:nuclease-related domain-containing protein n=1 Tax=Vibrio sp. SCSIO 43140 TaxID=2819100 RepID=UPI00207508E1|nr:nuclease-related domain-containing protein [Vibrio sp. SCSIO 43140]USD58933.1 NERD domain-containing protein [Vibrio sp. SCSIO 43140]
MKLIISAYFFVAAAYFFEPVRNILQMVVGGAMFIVSDLYILMLFVVFSIFALYRLGEPNRQKKKGMLGEQKVVTALSNLTEGDYKLINDVTLPLSPRGTTQIDHILLSKYGIFVIETKNYTGVLHGKPNDKKWTQVVKGRRHKMQNPLYQNVKHVNEVIKLLKCEPLDVHSLVVFVGNARLNSPMPEKVVQLTDLLHYIRHFKHDVFTQEQVSEFVDRIEETRLKPGLATDRLHLKFLQSKRTSKSKDKSGLTL